MESRREHTVEETIHDLEALKQYFMKETNGCYPVCLEDAIRLLETIKLEVE